MITDTHILADTVPIAVRQQLACPTWCSAGGHDMSDATITRQGAIDVDHCSVSIPVGDDPMLQVQARHWLGWDFTEDGFCDEGIRIHLTGLDEEIGVSTRDAAALATAITTLLATVGVQP